MNISNDIVFTAVSAFVDAISDGIARSVEAKVSERMDRMDKLIENTLNNTPAIIENLNDRIQKLEDRFDQLTTASDDRIVQIIKEDSDIRDVIRDTVEQQIESALENYDPSEALDDSYVRDDVEGSAWFEDAVADAVRNLKFTVEVN